MLRSVLLFVFLPSIAAAFTLTSPCGEGRCRRSPSTSCVFGNEPECLCGVSAPGVLCAECLMNGYLQNGTCVCARARDSDPNARCAKLVPVVSSLEVNATFTTTSCSCAHSWTQGLFVSSDTPKRTGEPNPPACDSCVSAGVGPDPSGVRDVEFGVAPQACTRYGGADPLVLNPKWTECSGHGVWNTQTHSCDCDAGWMPRVTAYEGFQEEKTSTCDLCAPLWGPWPRCDVVVTPDPIDDVIRECGGHGVFSSATTSCACFSNSTAGYWTLRNVTVNADVWDAAARQATQISVTHESCVACVVGFVVSQGCA